MITFGPQDLFLVTGATGAIGTGICDVLSSSGASVVACGRGGDALQSLVEAAPRRRAMPLELLGKEPGAWLRDVVAQVGPLRGIVHAAGVLELAPLRVASFERARQMLEVNTLSALGLCSAFMGPGIHVRGGAVVLVSSGSSERGLAAASLYSATKGALNAAVRGIAREYAPLGLRANAVLPGVVESRMTRAMSPDRHAYLLAQQFLAGGITPVDIGHAVAFLLHPASRFVTGQCWVVDGGGGERVLGNPVVDDERVTPGDERAMEVDDD